MMAVHARVGGDDRDIGGGILVATADSIHPDVEGKELLIAEDILHDDDMPDGGALLLSLRALSRRQAQTQVELMRALRADDREAILSRGLQLLDTLPPQRDRRITLGAKDFLHRTTSL